MRELGKIIRRLREVGLTNNVWGWSEIKRLPKVLDDDEEIERAVTGFYEGGHALVLSTNKRITFLDAKIMSFRVEDIHYEMVSEVEHFIGILTARLRIHCLSRQIELRSFSQQNVADFAFHVDGRVNEMRANSRSWRHMVESVNSHKLAPRMINSPNRPAYSQVRYPFRAE